MIPFQDRLLPAPRSGGFSLDDFWIWCGSVVRGEDDRFHMFAARVPKAMPFSPHWLFNSEIVRASSDVPEGPYHFEEVVFERRDRQFFDGLNTHNPTIHRIGDEFALFYMGCTYDEPIPDPNDPTTWVVGEARDRRYQPTWANKRIGLATSQSVFGPWKRRDTPLLEPRTGHWDAIATTNPAVCILEEGSAFMLYKSRTETGGNLHLGVAFAPHWSGPYRALSDEPIFVFDDPEQHLEDPYLWRENGVFNVIMKDMTGGICGEEHAGIHATSPDCLHWTFSTPAKAYSRRVLWDDGETTLQGSFERPQLLIQNGVPTHLFAATADGPGGFWNASKTWNMCVPLRH